MPNAPSSGELNIALVAGEASGDLLGAELIAALRQQHPGAQFFGVGGERMAAEGFDCWWSRDELSVMGLFEVLRHLPRLVRLRRAIRERLLAARPDVVIGIDAPDFNLGLERWLRQRGLLTVHYVSPTVWAWRSGRAAKIGSAADLVLCLFPFEPGFYRQHGVTARYAGHPLADSIPLHNDAAVARQNLGLDEQRQWVALLPGSRAAEVKRHAAPMLAAAAELATENPGLGFVTALADKATEQQMREQLAMFPGLNVKLLRGQALQAMAAADVVVCASGTASLECMLVNRPMVVVYRLSPATWFTARSLKLVKSRHISLPNLLAGEGLVPELIQADVNGPAIAAQVQRWLGDAAARQALAQRFADIHRQLRCGAAQSAAQAISQLLEERGNSSPAHEQV
jgi:lipid-A-disaccharide synthase